MKVVIFGATGFSGKAILAEALSKNYQVTILVRKAAAVSLTNKNLNVVEGSVLDRETVNAVLKNQDAVIQCLGVGGKGDGKPTTFVSDANQIIMEEMEKNQVPRLIAMSIAGAGNSHALVYEMAASADYSRPMVVYRSIITGTGKKRGRGSFFLIIRANPWPSVASPACQPLAIKTHNSDSSKFSNQQRVDTTTLTV